MGTHRKGQRVSETRQAYNVTQAMQPGPELDALVARVIDWEKIKPPKPAAFDEMPHFSHSYSGFLGLWEWLEKNHPWRYPWGDRADISLSRGRVYVNQSGPNGVPDCDYTQARKGYNFYFQGNTYPHAVSLAVVEVGRMLGVIDI